MKLNTHGDVTPRRTEELGATIRSWSQIPGYINYAACQSLSFSYVDIATFNPSLRLLGKVIRLWDVAELDQVDARREAEVGYLRQNLG